LELAAHMTGEPDRPRRMVRIAGRAVLAYRADVSRYAILK